MNRLCRTISTGEVIEIQSGGYDVEELREGRLNTLKQNAINAGINADDIEVKWITDDEMRTLMVTPARQAEREAAIDNLRSIDIKSIRALREWLITQPTCPQFLKNYEEQAKAERKKL